MFVTQILFPHIFVWGSCFWLCTSARPRLAPPGPASPPPPAYSHTHTQLAHTHTQLVTTQLTHTQLAHTLVHTQLAHTCSHTTWPHTTWPHTTYSHTQLDHTQLAHTTTTYSHTTCSHNLFTHNLHTVAGVALGDIDHHFAWQAWHLATWTCILRGRRNTYRTGLALMARLGPSWRRGRRPCLRGRRGTWRATLTVTLRGRRGTWWHRPSLCVAGVALGDMDVHSAWQA